MTNDMKIAMTFATFVVALVAVVGFVITVNTVIDNSAVVKMVGDGADPIVAACAVRGWGSSDALICVQSVRK
jgi:hypothetical protein